MLRKYSANYFQVTGRASEALRKGQLHQTSSYLHRQLPREIQVRIPHLFKSKILLIQGEKWLYTNNQQSQKHRAAMCLSTGLQNHPAGGGHGCRWGGIAKHFKCSPQKVHPARAGTANTWLPSPAAVLNYSSRLHAAPKTGGKGDEAAGAAMAAAPSGLATLAAHDTQPAARPPQPLTKKGFPHSL